MHVFLMVFLCSAAKVVKLPKIGYEYLRCSCKPPSIVPMRSEHPTRPEDFAISPCKKQLFKRPEPHSHPTLTTAQHTV